MVDNLVFVPLTNDLLFKEMLIHPENRDILIYFLEVFTELPKEIITNNLTVTSQSILNKSNYFNKNLTSDIIVKFDNYIVNIEMYSTFSKGSLAKSIVYGMRIFSTQLQIGDDYNNLANMIQVNILDKVHAEFNKNFKSCYVLKDIYNENELLKDEFLVKFYRIDKTREETYNDDKEHLLLRFIGAKNRKERRKIAKGDKLLMKADEWMEKYLFEDGFVQTLNKWKRQDEVEVARLEGEESKAIDMAKSLKESGVDIEIIAKSSGLSKEEIKKL